MMRRFALPAFAIAALLLPGWAFAQGEPPAQEPAVRVFEALPNGGVIELQRASGDSAGMRTIRARLRGIAQALSAGDFAAPGYLHLTSTPGALMMANRRNVIRYDYRELPRGGALRISTSDAVARQAIWEFIAFQRNEQMSESPDPR